MKTWIQEGHPENAGEPSTPKSVRDQLIAIREIEGMSISALSQQIGYSPSVLSQYLHESGNKYPGDTGKLERRVTDWMRSLERRRRIGVPLIECEVSKQIGAAIEAIRRTNDVGLIFGDAGIGKTCAIALYCDENPTCVMITVHEWAHDVRSVEGRIFDALPHGDWDGHTKRGDYIAGRLKGSNRLLVVDNAHKLSRPALQWLFDFHDETACPIALVGNENVMAKIADNDQRFSRVGLKLEVVIKRPGGMIRHLLKQFAPDAGDGIDDLCDQVVEQQGRFRALAKGLSIAAMIREGNGSLDWPTAFRAGFEKLVRNYKLADPAKAA